jgi:hypothetical protein
VEDVPGVGLQAALAGQVSPRLPEEQGKREWRVAN